jgi:hypothetical protein
VGKSRKDLLGTESKAWKGKIFMKVKKIAALVLCIVFLILLVPVTGSAADVWAGTTAAGYDGGSGTQFNPYRIATGAQLAYLADQVNNGTDYIGKYFKLTSDIDLNSTAWTPIGNETYTFNATFDGSGRSITGLDIDLSKTYAALFARNTGIIQNLSVAGEVSNAINTTYYSGGIVGFNSGTIKNCNSGCTINGDGLGSADAYTGGIAGGNTGLIVNCRNTGTVTIGGNNDTDAYCGGIAGTNSGSILNCSNTAWVHAAGYTCFAGGIAGSNDNLIENCYSGCFINTNGYGGSEVTGGVAARNAGTIRCCYWRTSTTIDGMGTGAGTISLSSSFNQDTLAIADTAVVTLGSNLLDVLNGWGGVQEPPYDASLWKMQEGVNSGLPVHVGTQPGAYNTAAAAGTGGSISPSGSVSTAAGADRTFTVTPGAGYAVDKVFVDGTQAALTNNTYTCSSVSAPHSITATFQSTTVLTQAGYGGTISGSGPYTVAASEAGYVIDSLWVDGAEVPAASGAASYQVDAAASSIIATFSYTVNFNQPTNGTLAVASAGGSLTSGSVIHGGEELTITVTPDNGYTLGSLVINGADVTSSYNSGYVYTVGTTGTYRTLSDTVSEAGTQGAEITASFVLSYSGSGPVIDPEPDEPVEIIVDPSGKITISSLTIEGTAGLMGISARLTEGQMTSLIESAVTGSAEHGNRAGVRIDVASEEGSSGLSLTFPETAFGAMNEAGISSVTVTSSLGSVRLDGRAIASIAGQASGPVTLSVTPADLSAMTANQRERIGTRPVYDFSLVSEGKTISGFGGGRVTVTLPYVPAPGEDPNKIVIFYLDDRGALIAVPNCVYDPLTGTVTFSTGHFSVYAVGYGDTQFDDVFGWYADFVDFTAARGLMNGVSEGRFDPEGTLTRGMFVTILHRLSGDTASYVNVFSDVTPGKWYEAAAAWASENGIVSGVGNNRFAPESPISREQLAVMLYQYAMYMGYDVLVEGDTSILSCKDASDSSDYAVPALEWAWSAGILNGDNGSLNPKGAATRAQVAKITAVFVTQTSGALSDF